MPCQDHGIPTMQQFPDTSDSLAEEEHDGSIVSAHIKPIVLSGKVDKGQLGFWVKTEKCVAGVSVWTWRSRLERPAQYLGLGQAQFGRQVCPLWQGQVLGLLEALVQRLQLQAGVNGAGFPDLLPLPVKPHLPVLDHGRGFLVFWREQNGETGMGYRQHRAATHTASRRRRKILVVSRYIVKLNVSVGFWFEFRARVQPRRHLNKEAAL